MKRTLLLFLFVGISGFVLASSGTIPDALKPVGSKTDWSKVSAIAACVAALTGVVAVGVYALALIENQKLSKIANEQVRIQNSLIAFDTYKSFVENTKGIGDRYASASLEGDYTYTYTDLFRMLRCVIHSSSSSEFIYYMSEKQFGSICEGLKIEVVECIDKEVNLTEYHKLQLLALVGKNTGLDEIYFTESKKDCTILFKEYDSNEILNEIVFSSTPLYSKIQKYNDIRHKYIGIVLNSNNLN